MDVPRMLFGHGVGKSLRAIEQTELRSSFPYHVVRRTAELDRQGWTLQRGWNVRTGAAVAFKRLRTSEGPAANLKTKLFHGTKPAALSSILRVGLEASLGGLFGRAVYLTPHLPKAALYASTDGPLSYILVVDALLGVISTTAADKTAHTIAGYADKPNADAWLGSLAHTEFAVRDARRVLVTAVLEYKRGPLPAAFLSRLQSKTRAWRNR